MRLNENSINLNLFENFQSKFLTITQKKFIQKTQDLVTPISLSFLKNAKITLENVDIVHIHSYYNVLNLNDLYLLKASSKPIFFTLHDQRIFTGGCHCIRDCKKFLLKCEMCPQINSPFKDLAVKNQIKLKELFRDFPNAHFISPSKWLAELAESSAILQGKTINHIYNSIPLKNELPNREDFRTGLGLTNEDVVLGFVSPDLNNSYKGFNVLVSAINKMSLSYRNKKYTLIIVGKGKVPVFDKNVRVLHFESLPNDQMFPIYSAMDLLIVPSTQDNSPNVILESLIVGTPVIGSTVGGITELLNQFGLPNFKSNDVYGLCDAIANFEFKYDRSKTSLKAVKLFGTDNTTIKIAKLYSEAI